MRVGMADLGAEQDDLRRVVDPDQQHDERCGRAVRRFQTLAADVPGDGELARLKQEGGDKRTWPNIAPTHGHIGKPLEEHGEEDGEDAQRNGEVHRLP